jgi:microcystin-dependent protein
MTVDLSTADGYYVSIAGNTAITGFGTESAGIPYKITFTGTPIITYNATSLVLPGAANITAAVGDVMELISLGGGNWKCTDYNGILTRAADPTFADNSTKPASTGWVRGFLVPAGTIIDFGGTAAPTGYLACPTASGGGQIVSRTTYAALFAAIGTTWGAGDGSTTFGMPWFAADYAAIQANGNVGTSIIGSVASHDHAQRGGSPVNGNSSLNPGYPVSGATAASTAQLINTGTAGGAANLPAGARVLKCVKY